MTTAFPEDAVLIARGQYATVAGEKREHLKDLRHHLESISSCAARVIRAPDDMAFMGEQASQLAALTENVMKEVLQLRGLQAHLDQLRPCAWGGKAQHE